MDSIFCIMENEGKANDPPFLSIYLFLQKILRNRGQNSMFIDTVNNFMTSFLAQFGLKWDFFYFMIGYMSIMSLLDYFYEFRKEMDEEDEEDTFFHRH